MRLRNAKATLAFAALATFSSGCQLAQGEPERSSIPSGYSLVWADEFDGSGLPDFKKWGFDTRGNRELWWHNERQYYAAGRRENSRQENGKLIIETRKEQLSREPDWAGQEYSSARLITEGRASWRYGFFDIRAKLPCGRGSWPAIWLLSDRGYWPKNGEIDIMEHVGHEPNRIHATLHNSVTERGGGRLTGSSYITDACGKFYNYQMDWRADSITFFVDGKEIYTAKKPADARYEDWPYDHKFHLLINVAVGGAWGNAKGIDPNAFPTRMEVDYVRVYQARQK
jgi:beta-glucanase (GH16 family)